MTSTAPLNQYAIRCTGKERPHVLFIPTASGDAGEYIENVREYYEELGCTFSALCLITEEYDKTVIDELIADADIYYIGGGEKIC